MTLQEINPKVLEMMQQSCDMDAIAANINAPEDMGRYVPYRLVEECLEQMELNKVYRIPDTEVEAFAWMKYPDANSIFTVKMIAKYARINAYPTGLWVYVAGENNKGRFYREWDSSFSSTNPHKSLYKHLDKPSLEALKISLQKKEQVSKKELLDYQKSAPDFTRLIRSYFI